MKSKLGIQVGFLACICYLVGLLFGAFPLTLLAGYILLKEDNEFLRFSALKSLLIVLLFSVATTVIYLLPDAFTGIDWITRIANAETYFNNVDAISKIDQIIDFLVWIINMIKKILMLLLALKACSIKMIRLPLIDGMITKYLSSREAA